MNLNNLSQVKFSNDNFEKPKLNKDEIVKKINSCLKNELFKPVSSIDSINMFVLNAKETIEQQLYNLFYLINEKDYIIRIIYGLTFDGDVMMLGLKLSNINIKDGNLYNLNIPIKSMKSNYIRFLTYGISTSTDLDQIKKLLIDLPYDTETIFDLDSL